MEPTEFTRGMGANLRRLRNNRGLTAEQVSERMGISPDSVFKYEAGQRHMSGEMVLRAAKLLGCSILDIYRGLDPDKPEERLSEKELNVLSPAASAVMRWLATEWDGDTEALVLLMGMVATFPVEERRELYMEAVLVRDRLVRDGRIKPEQLPRGLGEMERKLGGLYDL